MIKDNAGIIIILMIGVLFTLVLCEPKIINEIIRPPIDEVEILYPKGINPNQSFEITYKSNGPMRFYLDEASEGKMAIRKKGDNTTFTIESFNIIEQEG